MKTAVFNHRTVLIENNSGAFLHKIYLQSPILLIDSENIIHPCSSLVSAQVKQTRKIPTTTNNEAQFMESPRKTRPNPGRYASALTGFQLALERCAAAAQETLHGKC